MPSKVKPVKAPALKPTMTRSDSLKSMSEFGRIVQPKDQAALRAKKKPKTFVEKITDALTGR